MSAHAFKSALTRRMRDELTWDDSASDVERDMATFGADSPGTPAIILTHDASPGAGDLNVHSNHTLGSSHIARARRGMPIFVTGGKVSDASYAAGFVPVTIPQAFDATTGLNGIGQVSGWVAADLVQLSATPPVPGQPLNPPPGGAPALNKPAPAPSNVNQGSGPSKLAIGAGILLAGGAVYGGAKLMRKKK